MFRKTRVSKKVWVVHALGLALFLIGREAVATCGSSSCFLDTGRSGGLQPKGSLLLDLSFQFVDQTRKLAGRDGVSEVLAPAVSFEEREIEPDHHREIATRNTLVQLALAYGVTKRLSLEVLLPLVVVRNHEHFDDVGSPGEFFTRQDGSSGFGDVRAMARYGLLVARRDLFVADVGVKLPTGSYRQRDSEGDINEPTLQPGSGSTDLLGAVRWSRQIVPRKFEAFTGVTYRLGRRNDLGYRFGEELVLNTGFEKRPGGSWAWSFQLNARRTGRDRYLGQPVPSTGALLVNLSPGVRFIAPSGTEFYGFVQVPILQDVNEAQLAPATGILLGIAKQF